MKLWIKAYLVAYIVVSCYVAFGVLKLATFRATAPSYSVGIEAIFPTLECVIVFLVGCFYSEFWRRTKRNRLIYFVVKFALVPLACIFALPSNVAMIYREGGLARDLAVPAVLFVLLSMDLFNLVAPVIFEEIKARYPNDFSFLDAANARAKDGGKFVIDALILFGVLVLLLI